MTSEAGPLQSDTETTSKPDLYAEIEKLRARVASLESQIGAFQTDGFDQSEVIVLRTIERDEAAQEILQLFRSGETLFYSDIAKRLQLDLQPVVEICQELIEAEEIEVDAWTTTTIQQRGIRKTRGRTLPA